MQYVSNQTSNDFKARAEDRTALLNAAVQSVARQLLVTVPPSQRSKSESQMLFDCARGRRAASTETLTMLLAIETRAATPFLLSSEIQAIEVRLAEKGPVCAEEASDAEDAAQVLLDQAQKLAEREKTPIRWRQVWEGCRESLYRIRRLMDAAAVRASGRVAS